VLELTSYGLTGLAAMVVIAFCFAYDDGFPPALEKFSFVVINNARLNDFPMSVETSPAAIHRDSFQNDRGPVEACNG